MSFEITVVAPGACTQEEIGGFVKLLRSGGQVSERGLEALIKRAERLILAKRDDLLVGTGGLKRPRASYLRRLEERFGINLDQIGPELGWVVVAPQERGRGVGQAIVLAAIGQLSGRGCYATTQASNRAMSSILLANGFVATGGGQEPTGRSRPLTLYLLAGAS